MTAPTCEKCGGPLTVEGHSVVKVVTDTIDTLRDDPRPMRPLRRYSFETTFEANTLADLSTALILAAAEIQKSQRPPIQTHAYEKADVEALGTGVHRTYLDVNQCAILDEGPERTQLDYDQRMNEYNLALRAWMGRELERKRRAKAK